MVGMTNHHVDFAEVRSYNNPLPVLDANIRVGVNAWPPALKDNNKIKNSETKEDRNRGWTVVLCQDEKLR